jgi:hypothetical protein
MVTTFLKRQKEMKRQEKQREKAERRKQKNLAKRTKNIESREYTDSLENLSVRSEPDPEK